MTGREARHRALVRAVEPGPELQRVPPCDAGPVRRLGGLLHEPDAFGVAPR
jgi:hypothetical protein